MYMQNINFLVCVECMTYNHVRYIVDAMNGFCIQQTNFPYVCTIIDDASSDGEQQVIKSYLNNYFDLEDKSVIRNEETNDYFLIFAPHKTNRNCYFAVLFLKHNHYSAKKPIDEYIKEWTNSKYIAICEGDDYWIHDEKLQKQVDFLEENPSYNMIYTHYKENHGGNVIDGTSNLLEGYCLRPYLLQQGYIPTASVMYRSSFKFDNDYLKMNFPLGDVPTWIQMMYVSPVKLLPETTTVYRILEESASHSKNYGRQTTFLIEAMKCRLYFAEKYEYKDICVVLERRIKIFSLLLELYNGNYLKFMLSKPWKNHIGFKQVYNVLRERIRYS